MMYRHLRTNTLYRVILSSFCVSSQRHQVVYMSMDTGEIFNRSKDDFAEKFILVNNPQENIKPKNEARLIWVNAVAYQWHGYTLSYEELMELLKLSKTTILTVVWSSKESREGKGTLIPGQTMKVYPEMRIEAVRT